MLDRRQRLGLALGLLLFAFLVFAPLPAVAGLTPAIRKMVAVTALMCVWWVSEPIPLAATALLPLVAFPLLGIASSAKAAAPYANQIIFLLLGSFMLAQAMERWNLHRRIALHIVRRVGTNPSRMVLGFMSASAAISMGVSNTATVAMMMPIGLAVILELGEAAKREGVPLDTTPGRFPFGTNLMLGIAYGASIGGVGTLIGTPPNLLVVGALEKTHGIRVSFLEWLAFGVPLVVIFVPLAWWWLTRRAYPLGKSDLPGGVALIEEQIQKLGPIRSGERRTAAVFAATALAWIFQPLWTSWFPLGPGIAESTVAIAGAVAMFLLPAGDGRNLLDWDAAVRLPWDIVLLFGGGLALAEGFDLTGLSSWVGENLKLFSQAPLPLFVLGVVAVVAAFTEFASNTATAAMVLPILAAAATGVGLSPALLCVPAGMAASLAFMLPASTPPNAIVFGTHYVTIPQMMKAGLAMNFFGVILVTLAALFILRPLLAG
jgi:sodium-dependent dicarboxylate transporter 2/3/5